MSDSIVASKKPCIKLVFHAEDTEIAENTIIDYQLQQRMSGGIVASKNLALN